MKEPQPSFSHQSCRCSQRQRPPWQRAATRTKDDYRTTETTTSNVAVPVAAFVCCQQSLLPPWRPSCDSAVGRQRQLEKARGPMICCHEESEADPAQQRRTTTTQQPFRLRLDPQHVPRMIMIVRVTICPRRKHHRPGVLPPVCCFFPKIPKSHPLPLPFYRRPLQLPIISTHKHTAGGTARRRRHHRLNPNGRKYHDGVCRGF
jgi:hypothetical protein